MNTMNPGLTDLKVDIRESISSSLTIIAVVISIIGYGLYEKDKYINRIGLPIYIIVLFSIFCFLFYKLFKFAKRNIIMSIDKQGVYHKDYKLMKWEDILSIKRTSKNSSESEIKYFIFQTSKSPKPYKIAISNLDISEKALIGTIRNFRDYNIYEIPYDEL